MKLILSLLPICIILSLVLANPVFAQEPQPQPEPAPQATTEPEVERTRRNIWFGIKIGTDLNLSQQVENVTFDLENNYKVGAFVQFGRRLFLQPELYYARFAQTQGEAIEAIVAPVSLGLQLIDIGLISLNIKGGAEFSRKLIDGADVNFLWQLGVGANVLGFITADVKYSLEENDDAIAQIGDLVSYGGVVTATVGFRFR